MELKVILATIAFVLPGFITSMVLDYALLRRTGGQLERANESVILTIVVYTITGILPDTVFDWSLYVSRLFTTTGEIANPLVKTDVWTDLGFVVLVSIIVGLLLSLLLHIRVVKLAWIRLFGRNFSPSVWMSLWNLEARDYVALLEMKDGQIWTGTVEEVSDAPSEREILLRGPASIKADDWSVQPSAASYMLIDMANVQRLSIIPRNTYEAGTESDRTAKAQVAGDRGEASRETGTRVTEQVAVAHPTSQDSPVPVLEQHAVTVPAGLSGGDGTSQKERRKRKTGGQR